MLNSVAAQARTFLPNRPAKRRRPAIARPNSELVKRIRVRSLEAERNGRYPSRPHPSTPVGNRRRACSSVG